MRAAPLTVDVPLIARFRYTAAGDPASPASFDAERWRRNWFRRVGVVHVDMHTGELVCMYSPQHDPSARLRLQAELEAEPGRVEAVLQAVTAAAARIDRYLLDADIAEFDGDDCASTPKALRFAA